VDSLDARLPKRYFRQIFLWF